VNDPVVEVIGEDTTPQNVGTDGDASAEGDAEEQSAESKRSWLGDGPQAIDTVADLLEESGSADMDARNPAGSL
jgi:ribosomal protein S16